MTPVFESLMTPVFESLLAPVLEKTMMCQMLYRYIIIIQTLGQNFFPTLAPAFRCMPVLNQASEFSTLVSATNILQTFIQTVVRLS